jgi:hypothetical protein
MKNYTNNDYAINKFSRGIVYSFSYEISEVTLERFLMENPEKTKHDFLILKELSNEIYHEQDKSENAQTKKNAIIGLLEEAEECSTQSLENEYFALLDEKNKPTCKDGIFVLNACLTKIQKKRYLLLYYNGKTEQEIADIEQVTQQAINKSICAAGKRIDKYLKKFLKTGC